MPRRRHAPDSVQSPARPGPLCVIDPNAVYLVGDAQAALKLTRSTIRREVKEGRMRISKRAGRYYLLGCWILQWLTEGELPRRARPTAPAAAATAPSTGQERKRSSG